MYCNTGAYWKRSNCSEMQWLDFWHTFTPANQLVKVQKIHRFKKTTSLYWTHLTKISFALVSIKRASLLHGDAATIKQNHRYGIRSFLFFYICLYWKIGNLAKLGIRFHCKQVWLWLTCFSTSCLSCKRHKRKAAEATASRAAQRRITYTTNFNVQLKFWHAKLFLLIGKTHAKVINLLLDKLPFCPL